MELLDPEDPLERQEKPVETGCLASPEPLDLQAMLVLEHLARRASLDFPVLRVDLEVQERRGEATLGPPGTEASPVTLASLASLEHLVSLERKAPISPARFLESLESPDTLVSPDGQVIKAFLVPVETLDVLVLTVPKEKGENRATEANQDPKVSPDQEEIPVSQAVHPPVIMEIVGRTECLASPELRASLERCWGPRLDLLGSTASLGLQETRASLGLLEDLVHPVQMGVLECLG